MGTKLIFTGLTFLLAVLPMLQAFGLQASKDLVLVGAIIMVIGCTLMWLDK